MRIAIVYDCLYPNTVGGAERWYRALAEQLQGSGHEITYLTRRQWGPEGPQTSFSTIAISREEALYTPSGRRRTGPPLRFGWGTFWHLVRHGRRYDAVHMDVFPYFSVIGAWLALRLSGRPRPRIVVDWFELWTLDYWIAYLGRFGGRVGHAIQSLCTRLPDMSFVFSRLHEERLRSAGHRAPIVRLTGIFQGGDGAIGLGSGAPEGEPVVVFAGRHIPEKQVTAIPPAIARARREHPRLRCLILGDGPESERVASLIAGLGLADVIEMRGRVGLDDVQAAIRAASCLLLPSVREGYGLVVVEAVSQGTPAVVVSGPDNAATELIEEGVNGFVAASSGGGDLGAAIVEAIRGGSPLRDSTARWYAQHELELSIESSLRSVEQAYATESPTA